MRSARLARGRAGAATAAVAGVTSAVAMLALDPAPVQAASTSQNWANGITATGPVDLSPIPAVASGGATADKSLASLPANQALSASVLHVTAGADAARSAVADLAVANELKASLVTASCRHGNGDSKLVNAIVGGQALPVGVAPNTTIAVPPGKGAITKVVLNKQVPNRSGGVTVTAIEASLNVAGVAETVDVSKANCAGTASSRSAPPPAAPAPSPQQGTLPVTG